METWSGTKCRNFVLLCFHAISGNEQEGQPVEEQSVGEHDPSNCAGFLLDDADWVERELQSLGLTALSGVSETTLAPTASEGLEEAAMLSSLKKQIRILNG